MIREIKVPGLAEYVQKNKPSSVTQKEIKTLRDAMEIEDFPKTPAILIDLLVKVRLYSK